MKKIGIEKSALCPCGLEVQTTAHVSTKEKAPGQQKVP